MQWPSVTCAVQYCILWCLLFCCNLTSVSDASLIRVFSKEAKTLDLFRNTTDKVSANECFYQGKIYPHRSQITTAEPCLNCTCSHGTLVCYLRVCPKLPDPPPIGCIILQKYQACCSELICNGHHPSRNGIESRAEIEHPAPSYVSSGVSEGCFYHGTIYAEGSAMSKSTECEYCFCLSSQMKCIKPKCLLPQNECKPIFKKHSCCPVRYDCRRFISTTEPSGQVNIRGCWITGRLFQEGDKVPGRSNCDNCYCIHGVIKCEKLECAPILAGCEPIIPKGQCCASSYNCSGTIEVNRIYYKNPPIISNNYAHTETNIDGRNNRRIDNNSKIIDIVSNEISSTSEINTTTETVTDTTIIDTTTELTTTETDRTEISHTEIITVENCTINNSSEPQNFVLQSTTVVDNVTTITSITLNNDSSTPAPTTNQTVVEVQNSTAKEIQNITANVSTIVELDNSTVSVNNSTYEPLLSKIGDIFDEDLNSTEEVNSTEHTLSDGIKRNHIPLDIEVILNKTMKNHDYDEYDYNEPSLPPSLPNLKIIPFVAADAVDDTDIKLSTEKSIFRYDTPNLFSPPEKTEGGFLPKEPSFYENTYLTTNLIDITTPTQSIANAIRDTCISKDKKYRHGELLSQPDACVLCLCFFGEVVCQPPKCPSLQPGCRRHPIEDPAVCCGQVVCEDELPAIPLDQIDSTSDPFRDVIRTETPPNLQSLIGDIPPNLNTTTPTPTTQIPSTTSEFSFEKVLELFFSEEVTTEDPLESRIVNVDNRLNYIPIQFPISSTTPFKFPTTTMKPITTTTRNTTQRTITSTPVVNNVVTERVVEATTVRLQETTQLEYNDENNHLDPAPNGVGLLKLAGCNIYGRMYRVGRIISELSGPCLECMCTHNGVQCKSLKC